QLSGMTPSIMRAPMPAPAAAPADADAPAAVAPSSAEAAEIAAGGAISPVPIVDADGHLRPLEAIERDLIQYAIETYAGRMAEVARRLGIGRSTLYRKVREHDLEVDAVRDAG